MHPRVVMRTMCLATYWSLVLLSFGTLTTRVDASKTKNKAMLREKYGIDCGSHCTNAVVRLHEAIEQEKRLNHDKAVLSGAHDEAAVKQFLIEQAVVDSSELTNLGKSHTCVIERYSAYFPGQCVPTQAIMDYLSGKLVPEPNLDPSKDPV